MATNGRLQLKLPGAVTGWRSPRHRAAGRRGAARLAAAGAVALLLVAVARDASAAPEILRPGTRPWEAAFGIGPSIIGYTDTLLFNARGRGDVQFKALEQIGYHFSGDSSGPALGATLEEGFAYAFRFEAAAKFWWDIKVVDDLGVYLYPEAKVGFATWTNPIEPYFNMGFGFGAKIILDDRGMLFFRPISPNFFIGQNFIFSWDVMLGGGVTFP